MGFSDYATSSSRATYNDENDANCQRSQKIARGQQANKCIFSGFLHCKEPVVACSLDHTAIRKGLPSTTTAPHFLGTTKPAIKQTYTPSSGLPLLPCELLLEIMHHLDPVSQICLGLTSRHFYEHFHMVMDDYRDGKGIYEIKKYPFALNMRVSMCGVYMINWWWDDYGSLSDDGIQWLPSLGELIADEKTLFKGLKFCYCCLKYKPQTAYFTFPLEVDLYGKRGVFFRAGKEDMEYYWDSCRRCRARELLVHHEMVREVFNHMMIRRNSKLWESVGLLNVPGTNTLRGSTFSYDVQPNSFRKGRAARVRFSDGDEDEFLIDFPQNQRATEPCGGDRCHSWNPCIKRNCPTPVLVERPSKEEKSKIEAMCVRDGTITRMYSQWEDIFAELGI